MVAWLTASRTRRFRQARTIYSIGSVSKIHGSAIMKPKAGCGWTAVELLADRGADAGSDDPQLAGADLGTSSVGRPS